MAFWTNMIFHMKRCLIPEQNIQLLMHRLKSLKTSGKKEMEDISAVFDLRKAFVCVDHIKLLFKIQKKNGIRGIRITKIGKITRSND